MCTIREIHFRQLDNTRFTVGVRHQVCLLINSGEEFSEHFRSISSEFYDSTLTTSIFKTSEGRKILLSWGFIREWHPECMNPTGWWPYGIQCPTVRSGNIPAKNYQVWWLNKMISLSTGSESVGLFSVGIHQSSNVSDPSINTAGTANLSYGCLCQRISCHVIHYAQWVVQFHVQLHSVAQGHHFEHKKLISLISGKCNFVQRY